MNVVIQKHPEGCALASAAMLSGRSYDEVAAVAAQIGIRAGDRDLYGTTGPMRRLLTQLGVGTGSGERDFDGWNNLPAPALLAIKWHLEEGEPFWHWVVFVRDREGEAVLDPAAFLKEHRRTDFAAMQPKWFIEIRP